MLNFKISRALALDSIVFTSVAATALSFDVPRKILGARIKGRTNLSDTRSGLYKFTHLEEKFIRNWLISMDQRGAALTISMLRDMARLLLQSRDSGSSSTPPNVGINWPTEFIERNPGLTTRFSRKYDYKRAENEDPAITIEWFQLVEKTIRENGIISDDIYNFDEAGFAMEINATERVVKQAFFHGRRGGLQAGNREWVTVIESICASGRAFPPYIVFKGKISWLDGSMTFQSSGSQC
jgi:hypothetical protein